MLLEWGFREKDLATVIWLANVGNWASRRVAWKLGFAFEGTLRQWLPHRGELRDAWVGTLLAGDPQEPQGRWIDDACSSAAACGSGLSARTTPSAWWRPAGRSGPALAGRAAVAVHRPDDALSFIRGRTGLRASGRGLSWAVADPATDALLGSVGLFDLPDDLSSGEVGYWAHPDARGRGVMTAAVGLVLEHAFEARAAAGSRPTPPATTRASRHVLEANGHDRARASSASGRSSPRAGSMPCSTTSCVRSGHAGRGD